MIRLSSGNLSVNALFVFLFVFISFSSNLNAQTKKPTASKNKTQTVTKTSPPKKPVDKKSPPAKTTDKKDLTAKDKKDKKDSAAKGKKDKQDSTAKIKRDSAIKDKKDKKDSLAKTNSAKNDKAQNSKNDKTQKANLKRQAEEKRLAKIREAEEKRLAEIRQAEEAKRRSLEEARRRVEEEARRQAILEERRRREQARREAEARRRAFEKALHTETNENIANDDTEGEDLEVRRAAVKALGKHAGMVVVMEPQTGKVLSIVNQNWAIRKSFKPCSTIKLVTGVAGLNEHLITEEGNIRSRNFPMNLDDALAFSNNSYFQKVGSNLGNRKMVSYAQVLGLGQPTGINAEGEASGKLPYDNKNARIYSHGDDFEVSPLQLAVMVSAISTGGKVVVPKIPRTKFEKTNFRGTMRREVKLPTENLQGVVPGMIGAASYGTARRGVDASLGIAGKTGSCIGQGSWVGLFASVAPIENPQVAVVVITRGEGERGKYAAAVAGKIYQAMRSRLIESGSKYLAKIPAELKPESKVNAKISAQLDDSEDEDSEDNDVAPIVKREMPKPIKETPKIIIVGQANAKSVAAPAPKIIAKSTDKSATLFPSVVINVKKSRPRYVSNK